VEEELIQLFLGKIKHFLISNFGKTEHEASDQEFYWALSMAMKEELMVRWTAAYHTYEKKKSKIAYLLSLEYLPGKFLKNNISQINGWEFISKILVRSNRSMSDILAVDPEPGLGNGGLGRLVSCFLDSLATLKYPAFAYGLRYQYGIFEQGIWNGYQIEKPDLWLLHDYPWEIRKDHAAKIVRFGGKIKEVVNRHGDHVYHLEDAEEVRALPYDIPILGYCPDKDISIVTMRLWSTKASPQNFELQRFNAGMLGPAKENTSLTDVLYPNENYELGKRIRLKQEFLLVSASIQDILAQHLRVHNEVKNLPDHVQIQINDTHPTLVIPELIRRLMMHHDISFPEAIEITEAVCNFTNHTIMREALEEWNEREFSQLLPREHKIIQKINYDFCNLIRKKFPSDEDKVKRCSILENGQIKMAHLCIVGSKKVNGVSALHGEILKNAVFKDFYDLYPQKFTSITNGITCRKWLFQANPKLCNFITERIGEDWKNDFSQIKKLSEFASDKNSQEAFLKIKRENKEDFYNFLLKDNPLRDAKGNIENLCPILDSNALLDVQIKRYHEYKRQLMLALHTLMVMQELEKNPSSRKIKRFIVVGGKAAPGYVMAKKILTLLSAIGRKINESPRINNKIRLILLENYNVSKAQIIIPAADLSEQISTAGKEASGTGNMKLTMNGALTIATEDGANIEMERSIGKKHWPFSFGLSAEDFVNHVGPTAQEIYDHNDDVQRAMNCLKDHSLAATDEEHEAFCSIFDALFNDSYYGPDPFAVIRDLPAYYETQKKVEETYLNPLHWAELCMHNIAGMGPFSSDAVIEHYAKEIWQIKPCPIDKKVLIETKEAFSSEMIFSK
jgi:starch phosphorylase